MTILLEKDIKPKDIVTKKSLENAVRSCGCAWWKYQCGAPYFGYRKNCRSRFYIGRTLKEIMRLRLLGDFKPSGKFLMEDLYMSREVYPHL
jgi:dihydroxy-acid dehydratase